MLQKIYKTALCVTMIIFDFNIFIDFEFIATQYLYKVYI